MYELQRAESVALEAAVLVGVILPDAPLHHEDPLDELDGLAATAGARVMGRVSQRRNTPDKTTYLGKGKVEELRRMVERHDADVVIFDNNLYPAQTRNLEKALGVKVLDRTELILDIFAASAQTHEARLAVELAQLQYSLPRLKQMWTHLSRLKMGIGMRGPGEKQLEVDRRLVEKRIHDLQIQLSAIELRKQRQVASRHDRMTVSLVGYTNAGKSTLMNVLTDANVKVQDKLFATLDTRTRRWQLPGWGPVLLSDTVGFIRDLPHNLIASFKATLEETRQANLLLHVADASSPVAAEQIRSVYKVLEELGIEEKDTILVLNKIDNLPSRDRLDALRLIYPAAIPISARNQLGLNEFAHVVSDALSRHFVDVDVETTVDNGRLLAFLAAHGKVLSRNYRNGRVTVHCKLPRQNVGQINGEQTVVRPHANGAGRSADASADTV